MLSTPVTTTLSPPEISRLQLTFPSGAATSQYTGLARFGNRTGELPTIHKLKKGRAPCQCFIQQSSTPHSLFTHLLGKETLISSKVKQIFEDCLNIFSQFFSVVSGTGLAKTLKTSFFYPTLAGHVWQRPDLSVHPCIQTIHTWKTKKIE